VPAGLRIQGDPRVCPTRGSGGAVAAGAGRSRAGSRRLVRGGAVRGYAGAGARTQHSRAARSGLWATCRPTSSATCSVENLGDFRRPVQAARLCMGSLLNQAELGYGVGLGQPLPCT